MVPLLLHLLFKGCVASVLHDFAQNVSVAALGSCLFFESLIRKFLVFFFYPFPPPRSTSHPPYTFPLSLPQLSDSPLVERGRLVFIPVSPSNLALCDANRRGLFQNAFLFFIPNVASPYFKVVPPPPTPHPPLGLQMRCGGGRPSRSSVFFTLPHCLPQKKIP